MQKYKSKMLNCIEKIIIVLCSRNWPENLTTFQLLYNIYPDPINFVAFLSGYSTICRMQSYYKPQNALIETTVLSHLESEIVHACSKMYTIVSSVVKLVHRSTLLQET